MNSRFPILSTLSKILMFFGALSFIIGVGLIFFGPDFIVKFFGFLSIVLAVLLCVIGEIIGVAFAIEDNTKSIADFCEKMHDLKDLVKQSNSLLEQSNKILAQNTLAKNNSSIEVAENIPQSPFDKEDKDSKKMLSPFTFASEFEKSRFEPHQK
jgi:hypothetical protein